MANVVSLQTRQVFLAAGSPASYAQVSFKQSGTDTQVAVYSDVTLLSQRSQPVTFDANGVMPVCYVASPDPLRIVLTDEDDAVLPGYPMDNVVPIAAETAAANTIGFSPSDEVPETNVQDAVDYVAGLFADQSELAARSLTPFVTGGSGNIYTLTPSPAITAYGAGQSFLVRPNRSNTGAATLNINGLGAREIRKTDSTGVPVALVSGDIASGREFMVYDDGTYLLMTLGRDFAIYGTGANGSYVRLSDGTQICSVSISETIACATSNTDTGGYRSVSGTWTFPAAFTQVPVITASSGNVRATGVSAGSATTTTTSYEYHTVTTQTAAARIAKLVAVGRYI